MLFDATIKFLKQAALIQTTVNELGYAEHHIIIHGMPALAATLLYPIPKTSVLVAILLTGHFGGAITSNLRVDNPIFSHTQFPVYIGLLDWGGLWLRNIKLRQVFPFVATDKLP